MVYFLRPFPQANRRRLYGVEAGEAVCAEDIVPVPNVVLERDRLFKNGVENLAVRLGGRLAQQQPLELVLIACIIAHAIFILCKPLRARGAAAGQVCALQGLGYAVGGHETRLGASRRR
ncbi:MAG: hypothetical protein EOO77_47760 [Oxalobacteraceae bacterium]|nr:MAG: hypothetical protein EOO77_47760 [Oxalobacteraceae bacterium]